MPETFQSLNEPGRGGVPQFAQTSPVVGGDGASALVAAAGIGANLFSQVTAAKQKRELSEAKTASDTALGGLQQGLLDLRQAAATSEGIDFTRESRILLSKFNADHPELRMEASKAFKAETGNTPSGLAPDEEAEMKLRNEAISNGFGSIGASEEYNTEQLEMYTNLKRQDKVLSSKIQAMSAQVQEGSIHKSAMKDTVLSSFHDLSGTYSAKTQSDMTELVNQWESGTLSTEDAILRIRNSRNNVNREVATLGEFSTDPSVRAYTLPILDNLQLAEDIVTGKIEQEAINATINANKARSKAIFMSDPSTVNLVVASEAFNHTTGVQSKVSSTVMKFLTGGLTKEGMIPPRPKPIDPREMDKDEQDGTKATVDSMINDVKATPESKLEAANTVTGVAEHLSRNGMDFNPEDKKFAIDILNTKGALSLLSPEQKGVVMLAFGTYLSDDVDRAVRENVITVQIPVASSKDFTRQRFLGGDPNLKQSIVDVADLSVQDGRIYWTLKPKFKGIPSAQQAIRGINQDIDEDITPAVNVYSGAFGIPFDQAAAIFLPGGEEEEEEEEIKK